MTRMNVLLRITAVVMSALIVGCGEDPIVEWVGGATVYGRVLQPDGTPASGVTLRAAEGPQGACGSAVSSGISGPAVISSISGSYQIGMGGFGIAGTRCIKVVATPFPQSGFAPDSATVPAFQFGRQWDSVRVDFVLRPAA